MMNKKTLVRLGVVCGVAIAAAFSINHSRQPISNYSAKAGPLVEHLGEQINDVTALTISTPGQQSAATLKQSEGGWQVVDKGGYPADLGKLREYLLRVADSNLIEQKTASRERYPELGVSDLVEPGAKGIEVKINGLPKQVDFIAGVFNTKSSGTYVRRADEAQSWLATGNLIPDRNATDWLQKDLANISAERIASVTITQPDGKTLRVFKNAAIDAQYNIADLPKGREPVSEFAANGLAAALADLRIDDVAPASQVAPVDGATKVHFATFEGINVDALVWNEGDKRYVSFNASLDSEVATKHVQAEKDKAEINSAVGSGEAKPDEDGAESDADEAEPANKAPQSMSDLESEVASLNADFKGWSFILPAHKIGNMTKTMDEMLKPVEEKPAGTSKKSGK